MIRSIEIEYQTLPLDFLVFVSFCRTGAFYSTPQLLARDRRAVAQGAELGPVRVFTINLGAFQRSTRMASVLRYSNFSYGRPT